MPNPEVILDRAYRAIQSGSLTEISSIYAELDTVLPPLSRAEAERLRDKALRNARGLEAALAGVRAAKRRVAEVLRAQDGMTYDAQGKISALPKLTAQLSRKL